MFLDEIPKPRSGDADLPKPWSIDGLYADIFGTSRAVIGLRLQFPTQAPRYLASRPESCRRPDPTLE